MKPRTALEQDGRLAQDASPPTAMVFEAKHARSGRLRQKTTTSQQKRYQAFADKLRDAMTRANVNASEVARRVWGTAKDKRGYDVARNRDRIGHYLSGSSYPEPENLARLADAVGVTVEELAMPPETAPSRELCPIVSGDAVAAFPYRRRRKDLAADPGGPGPAEHDAAAGGPLRQPEPLLGHYDVREAAKPRAG
jgi:transcriptional regulator with XRE-family HTH domain